MNPIDDQLNRLFQAARASRADLVVEPPFGLETRAVAAYRSGASGYLWDTGLLIKGLILASLIMGISFWPLVNQTVNPFAEYLQLTDSTTEVDNN